MSFAPNTSVCTLKAEGLIYHSIWVPPTTSDYRGLVSSLLSIHTTESLSGRLSGSSLVELLGRLGSGLSDQ